MRSFIVLLCLVPTLLLAQQSKLETQLKQAIKDKKENKVNEKKEENYIDATIYLKKLKVVRPDAYQLSESLLSWYPEKVMFDFLVYKIAFYLRKREYRRYLLPEGHSRFLKGEKIQYELPLYL